MYSLKKFISFQDEDGGKVEFDDQNATFFLYASSDFFLLCF